MTQIQDQPPPTHNDRPDVQSLVIQDVEERRRLGIERYGTPLQARNGRDALVDAYQEALDLCMYLRQAIEERCSDCKNAKAEDTCPLCGLSFCERCVEKDDEWCCNNGERNPRLARHPGAMEALLREAVDHEGCSCPDPPGGPWPENPCLGTCWPARARRLLGEVPA